ncbi:MAG TPA: TetR/AcrR family transcriptional regulator [Bacteroidia bacterium]|jgi:AcrR family transcriptional regulator|nr:TetR/AcrR family transcriptional regulator [Bacteroidia bacterium]
MSVKKQILDAAEELFFHYGIKTITMDDIAKHLGMSKRTIYENFPTKDDIIDTLMKNHLEHNVDMCNNRTGESKNAIEEIIFMMEDLRDMFSRMNPRILFDLKKFHPKAWQQFKSFKNEFLIKTISDNIKRGIAEGVYRKKLNVDVLARMRIEQVEMAWNPEIFPSGKYELKDVQLAVLEHFLYGITNIKGHKLIEKYKKNKNVTVSI